MEANRGSEFPWVFIHRCIFGGANVLPISQQILRMTNSTLSGFHPYCLAVLAVDDRRCEMLLTTLALLTTLNVAATTDALRAGGETVLGANPTKARSCKQVYLD